VRQPVKRASVLLTAALCAWSAGCGEDQPAPAPLDTTSAELNLDDIGDGPVSGTLRGGEFTAADVRFRRETFEGRERVDIFIAEEAIEMCGIPRISEGRRVWLRFPGTTELAVGEQRVDPPDTEPFSVHYDIEADEGWEGYGGGAAVVAVDEVGPRMLRGRLHVCFDDGAGSCVAGSFRAGPCISALEVDDPVQGAAHLQRGQHGPSLQAGHGE
jgi:hypothetical protein